MGGHIEAEDYSVQSGIDTEDCSEGGKDVAYIENGDYIGFRNVDFGDGVNSIDVRVGANSGGNSIEIRLGAPNGKIIGTIDVTSTGGWQTWATQKCSIDKLTGINDIYLVFKGGSGYLFNVNWLKLNYISEDDTFLGDSNIDGNVDIADAVLLKCYLLNGAKYSISEQGKLNSDVQNKGNGINSQDALAILKYSLKIIKSFDSL